MRSLALVTFLTACASSPAPRVAPSPPEPVAQLIAAFDNHPIVALDEGGHGNEAVHAFVERLIRDPRFPANDLVVEFGSARFQGVADRFVVEGADVPRDELRAIWQQTTQVLVWDAPVYERLLRTVRDVNRARPTGRKLRVVLGDPPIDWSTVQSFKDWARSNRDAHAAEVIEREVLAKQRKALVFYGAMHLARRSIMANYEPGGMLVERLERARPGVTFVVSAKPLAIVATAPTLVDLKTSEIGARDFADVLGDEAPPMRFDEKAGKPLAAEAFAKRPFRDIFDALLFVGATVTYSEPPPAVLADDAYYAELVRRSNVLNKMALDQIEALRAAATKADR